VQGRPRQQNPGKRPQVVAMIGGDLELLDACFLIVLDSSKGGAGPAENAARPLPKRCVQES